ncbi:MAG: enoyl-CoA hydratase/isomerase family protein [Gammaproteobacteria bacterium]|nr:enoyl-CoA hydratase/isomerase family protein [Gammaproteobacteria bacterium]
MPQDPSTNIETNSITAHISNDYVQLSTDYHIETRALWAYMHAEPRPCFTWTLLNDLRRLFSRIDSLQKPAHSIDYLIVASGVAGVYNLGGDLENFPHYIRARSAEKLQRYAYDCLELGYRCYRQFDRDITSIALIEGSCYGGGFEAALSCNVLIVEESANISFPEISFNLFPGMGAYSYLTRRVTPTIADKMISSGRAYSGREIFELGIADVCAPDGTGVEAAFEFIKQHRRQQNARVAMHKARQTVQPVTLEELKHVSDIWVEAALRLDERSLRVMERFARAQLNHNFTRRVSTSFSQVA